MLIEKSLCKEEFKPTHKGSVFEDETKLIKNLLNLHNEGKDIDLDPCYSTGRFYKTLNKPIYKFDINPVEGVKKADVKSIPLANESVQCIIFDPPFMFGTHGQTKNNIMNKRFTMFNTFKDLEEMYKNALREFHRLLKRKGIILFKCQDYTDSFSTMTHCLVWEWAIKQGFYAKDLAILVKPNKIYNPNLKQRHLRKVHTYYWVFEKCNVKGVE